MGNSASPEQFTLPLGHRVAQGVENFLVTRGNRAAVDWIDRWPDWPFTALVVAGPPASGKTHLAALWKAKADAEAIRLDAIDIERAAEIAERCPIVIDDCDRGVRDADGQLILLQLYNLVRAAGRQMLLTAEVAPSAWGVTLADLSSRLGSAMVATIDPPDDATLTAVAMKLFADRQVAVDPSVAKYVISHGERSFAAVAETVRALDKAAMAGKRPITVALAREVLPSLESGYEDG